MSQIEVKILHQDYVLTCPDGQESQLMEAAERVDSQFEQMRLAGRARTRERLGVLLAVNLAYENLELRQQLQALQQQIAELQSADNASIAADDTLLQQLADLQAQQQHTNAVAQSLNTRIDAVLVPAAAALTETEPLESPADEAPQTAETSTSSQPQGEQSHIGDTAIVSTGTGISAHFVEDDSAHVATEAATTPESLVNPEIDAINSEISLDSINKIH